jgi:hypothetical protein
MRSTSALSLKPQTEEFKNTAADEEEKVTHEYIVLGPAELSGKHIATWGPLNGRFARR